MRAHSQDLRQRVLRAVDEGKSRAEIIERFRVSRAPIKRYVKQRRERGNVQPRPIPGRPNVKGKALQTELARQLEAHPAATLADHCRIWETDYGMQVSSATMSRAIRAGLAPKRSQWHPLERAIEEEPLSLPKLFKQVLQESRWGLF